MSKTVASGASAFGAAIASLLIVETPVSAAIFDLTINPAAINFPGSANLFLTNTVTGGPGGFFAFNDGFGKTFGSNGNGVSYFAGPLAPGTPITAGGVVNSFVTMAAAASGTYTFGFRTSANQVGWFRFSAAPAAPTVYLAAAWNNTPGESINAGQTAIPEPSSLALAGLAALAAGAGYVRQRRKAAKPA